MTRSERPAGFDRHASSYDADCMQGLRLSGEGRDYFARGRLQLLRKLWTHWGRPEPREIVDLGCGTGEGTVLLAEAFPQARVRGFDPSGASIEVAAARWTSERVSFASGEPRELPPVQLVHLSGVLHHVPLPERDALLRGAAALLDRDGLLALFENNPLNPGTRLVMSRIPFDRDAVPLYPREARRRVAGAGLRFVALRFLFYFPRWLAPLRPLERLLLRVPLGAQYAVLAIRD